MTYISPNCPAYADALARYEAEKRGDEVMPRLPFPWHRKEVREHLKRLRERE